MKDRYLYRAKRLDNGEWIEGSLITGVFFRGGQNIPYILCPGKADYDCFEDFGEGNGIFEIDPSTLCQSTGLKDKNGNLIFEGDIFLAGYWQWLCKVVWDSERAGFIGLTNDKDVKIVYVDMVDKHNMSAVEIIGNIFDNPELLEV